MIIHRSASKKKKTLNALYFYHGSLLAFTDSFGAQSAPFPRPSPHAANSDSLIRIYRYLICSNTDSLWGVGTYDFVLGTTGLHFYNSNGFY